MIDIPLSLFSNILFGYVQMNALQAHDVFNLLVNLYKMQYGEMLKVRFLLNCIFFLVFPLFLVVSFFLVSFVCMCVYCLFLYMPIKILKQIIILIIHVLEALHNPRIDREFDTQPALNSRFVLKRVSGSGRVLPREGWSNPCTPL